MSSFGVIGTDPLLVRPLTNYNNQVMEYCNTKVLCDSIAELVKDAHVFIQKCLKKIASTEVFFSSTVHFLDC
jgi:hypothetical protein